MIFQSLCLILFHADYQLCPRNILVICFQDTFRLTRYDLLLKQSICRSLFTKSGLLFFCNLCFLLKARIPGIKKNYFFLFFSSILIACFTNKVQGGEYFSSISNAIHLERKGIMQNKNILSKGKKGIFKTQCKTNL